jgi:gluconolactonase
MNVIEMLDERLHPVVAHRPSLERLCTGATWSEGPVWIAEDDSVLWSDIPNDRMLRW